ncbi:AAA family ATPase [Mucilaginibacter sp. KACC 22063]|uniref:AAA family ATPase n=1 Tax=Mucilaginibacter sp. KACC 22063 TaxID=3025666 RepID=UPI002367013D|nr:AAA family ATPase [Mucilaginibacter sp. KACC 22063]WDF54724.1 AAA family ATPase [Mucilaginibacter sp. KACC 22063]
MRQFVVISGCSGGGKSTLLTELSRRGYSVVEEPGRRIIADELNAAGNALPWIDLAAFARKAIEVSLNDLQQAANNNGWTFFDRGLVDAAAALEFATGERVIERLCFDNRYADLVFVVPPWPEIYIQDNERKHSLDMAIAEYERLLATYHFLNYQVEVLPKTNVSDRADLILQRLKSL